MKSPCASAASAGAGYTLIELLLVLVIMGTIGALALPQMEPSAGLRADAAAKELAQALRFAQAEAQRTGVYYMARCDPAAGTLAVTRLNTSLTPPAPDLSVPVLHPIDKKDYRIVFSALQSTTGAAIASCAFTYSDGKTVAQLTFGPNGAPVNLIGPNAPDIKTLTGSGQIVVASSRVRRTVQVSAASGRVSISQ